MDRESELALVRRLCEGDTAAFDIVYEAYHRRLYTFLVRLSGRHDLAEDMVEDTWLRLVAHAARLRPDTRLAPWLFAVARNLHYSSWRARRIDAVLASGSLLQISAPATEGPYETAVANQLQHRIEQALLSLSAPDREVLLLVGVDGFTPAEAAEICGVATEALRQRLFRARRRLTQRLENRRVPGPKKEMVGSDG